MWELVQLTLRELERARNIGSKSIEELKTIVAQMGLQLGMRFTETQLKAIQSYRPESVAKVTSDWFCMTAQTLTHHSLDFLSDFQKKILWERTWAIRKKRTLESLAQEHGMTRERVRQLERQALEQLHQKFRQELGQATMHLQSQVERRGGVLELPELRGAWIELEAIEQRIIEGLLELQTGSIEINWDQSQICWKA